MTIIKHSDHLCQYQLSATLPNLILAKVTRYTAITSVPLTFPVDYIVGVAGLAHYHTFLFAELNSASETIGFARILPAKVKAPSNLVGEVLQASVGDAVV